MKKIIVAVLIAVAVFGIATIIIGAVHLKEVDKEIAEIDAFIEKFEK